MIYHKFPFMASFFQLVENKSKNNLKLDITEQVTYNRFYIFINDVILEINYM